MLRWLRLFSASFEGRITMNPQEGLKAKENVLETLAKVYYTNIIQYCAHMLNYNYDAAIDCAQSVFLLASEREEILKNHQNPGGWLFKTARNLVCRTRKQLYENNHRLLPLVEQTATFELSQINSLGAEVASDDEIEDLRLFVLGLLSKNERVLYEQYFIDKKPSKLIALEFKISDVACRVRLHRLRQHLIHIVSSLHLD